jgi:hypothetical protein
MFMLPAVEANDGVSDVINDEMAKLSIVEGSIDNLIICAMAQIGGRATVDEITTEIHSYNDGKNAEQRQVESALMALLFVGEVTRTNDGWELCPIDESFFDYDELGV